MPKTKTSWVCRECGAVQPRWMGRCPECSAWDSLEEFREQPADRARDTHQGLAAEWNDDLGAIAATPTAAPISDITTQEIPRRATGVGEFDRVLGGGLVPGSVSLIGGEPGIGKSTLLLQAAAHLAASGSRVLYVTSEESAQQVQLRASRLDLPSDEGRLFVLADTNLARIFEQIRKVNPALVIVDSIQMVYKPSVEATPGAVTQLRRCATELVYLAKSAGIAIILVGHVTKDGVVAGPRLLEHLVDAVVYFEGDRYHAHRVVRAVKNRFGATLEIGLFEMTGAGLVEVTDAGVIAALDREDRAGSIVCPALHGARCFLVEVQALTATGILGAAKRKVSGLDSNRLPMLIAVLEKHGGLRLADQDVFVSSVGGLRIVEPAADLAVALAIAGAHLGRALDHSTIAVGEVGLGGEIRRVNQLEQRLREAARLGYRRALVAPGPAPAIDGFEIVRTETLNAAVQRLD
ncbi:MAG: DNA repair protein RadA [Phycisphaerales bacterium]